MRRALSVLVALASALTFGATLWATLWALAQHPFAAPLVERSAESARAAIARAMTLRVTPDWVIAEVEAALEGEDLDRLEIALDLATEHGIVLPRPLLERALAFAEAAERPSRQVAECAACAWDIASCPTLRTMALCALPVEMTPIGDANALRRGLGDYMGGDEVDRLDVGLALVGLAATGAVVVTAGGSAMVKAGATALRLARRAGTLTPGLARVLARNGDLGIDAARIGGVLDGSRDLSRLADPAKLARLSHLADDLGTVARNTSPAEAVALLRVVDSAEDARVLARLSDMAGGRTRATLAALGKSRAFRLMHRVSDVALATLGLLAALVAQVGSVVASLFGGMLRRAVR